jgi:hypothetical protein
MVVVVLIQLEAIICLRKSKVGSKNKRKILNQLMSAKSMKAGITGEAKAHAISASRKNLTNNQGASMKKPKEKTNMQKANELREEFIKDLKRSAVLDPQFIRQVENYMMAIHNLAFGAGVDARIKLKRGESYSS